MNALLQSKQEPLPPLRLSSAEIAALLGVSPWMVRIVARKFHKAGMPDPLHWKHKPALQGTLFTR